MIMKKHAIEVTQSDLNKAFIEFSGNGSANSFSALHRAMLAHQYATREAELNIAHALAGKLTSEITTTLADRAEKELKQLHYEVMFGEARIISFAA